ncbi:hypothetical protein GF323_04255 [Candidatus Woesearchaeota archaeon]|nr:hypothetical protein [Candidatus Woesearchaeota archaeon]
MKVKKEIIFGIFSLLFTFLVLFSLQFSSNIILGYDGYYHIKMAELIKDRGLVREFPWTQYSLHNENFADLHLGYHLLLLPFTLFSMRLGMKLAILSFSFALFAVFFYVLNKEKAKKAYLWIIVLLFSSYPVLLRANLGKLDMLSMIFFLGIVLALFNKKYYYTLLFSYLFTITYSFSIVLLLFASVFFFLEYAYNKKWDFKALFPAAGYFLGLLLNPYFQDNLKLLWIQIFQIGFTKPVAAANEWQPLMPGEYLLYNIIVLFLLGAILYMLFSKKTAADKRKAFLLVFSFISLTAGAFSRRFIVFAPIFIVWLAALCFGEAKIKPAVRRAALIFILMLAAANGAYSYYRVKSDINKFDIPYGIYETSQWLMLNTEEGSVVFTDEWWYFPILFYYNSHNYYLYGFEGNFGYAYDAELYNNWLAIVNGKAENPYGVIKEKFSAEYVLTSEKDGFYNILSKSADFEKVFEQDRFAVFKVRSFQMIIQN